MERFSTQRAGIVLAIAGVALIGLIGRTAYLQTSLRDRIATKLDRQSHYTVKMPARRGSIFDSTGQLLAGTVQTTTLFVDPKFMIDQYETRPGDSSAMERDLEKLSQLIDRDSFELLQQISQSYPSRYVELAFDVDENTDRAIRDLKLPGLGTVPASQRIYPMGSLAAHVLGGVGRDGHGIEGVELTQDKFLGGTDGNLRMMKDAARRPIDSQFDDYIPPEHGKHLVLTVDTNIQLIVERELERTVNEFGATGGEVVVLNPDDGSIIALANYPTFTPQAIEEAPIENRTNQALVKPYEPGSTIKPFIVARALEKHVTDLDDVWTINGPTWFTDYGRRITDTHGYEKLATWDVLVKSSNIGMSQLGKKMTPAMVHDGIKSFGFGRRSGLDLPGEENGLVNPLKKWTRHSLESVCQGYEMLVTPMQMARGMCVFANGGHAVIPHVVKGTLEIDGAVASTQPTTIEMESRVIAPNTADTMRRILADIPVRGTARPARSPVYNIFGKTGTAHRAVNGIYNETNYTSSFVGGAPYESPKLVIAVVIHDPSKANSHLGGVVAAPCASRILESSLEYLGIAPSPDLAPPAESLTKVLYSYTPDIYKKRAGDAVADGRD
ncbi:MAG TPA: penicillin-binding protein 2 [Tepidisphaeraceae bacterium]|nr:penicillin-binding protein 2 [Tepidisphaeraceae bacterium]